MSRFQTLVIRALLILIRLQYSKAPKDASIDERLAIMEAEWNERWLGIQGFERDAEAALEDAST